jgi:peptide/nickel transport system ATP-binding protein
MKPIIEISDLTVAFQGSDYRLTTIESMDLKVRTGETLAVIGESGSGKSVLGLSILGLLPDNAQIRGSVLFKGKNLIDALYADLQDIRGGMIAWIPQNPKTGFNPSMKMGKQVAEPSVIHLGQSWSEARIQAIKLFEQFHILPADYWAGEYPVSYSGGMLQRAMVAMGTSTNPEVIIADEPTKGVDVHNKADIVELFSGLKEKGITQIQITHDLDFAAELADRVVVIYCGLIVEATEGNQFFSRPHHPYSQGLLKSLPQNGLYPIPGSALPMHINIKGCRFRERCSDTLHECWNTIPGIVLEEDFVRCVHYCNRNRAG